MLVEDRDRAVDVVLVGDLLHPALGFVHLVDGLELAHLADLALDPLLLDLELAPGVVGALLGRLVGLPPPAPRCPSPPPGAGGRGGRASRCPALSASSACRSRFFARARSGRPAPAWTVVSKAMVVAVASRRARRLFSISRTDSSSIWIGTWDSASPRIALKMAVKKRRMRVNMAASPESGEDSTSGPAGARLLGRGRGRNRRLGHAREAPLGLPLRHVALRVAEEQLRARDECSGPSGPGGPRPGCACAPRPPRRPAAGPLPGSAARSPRGSSAISSSVYFSFCSARKDRKSAKTRSSTLKSLLTSLSLRAKTCPTASPYPRSARPPVLPRPRTSARSSRRPADR